MTELDRRAEDAFILPDIRRPRVCEGEGARGAVLPGEPPCGHEHDAQCTLHQMPRPWVGILALNNSRCVLIHLERARSGLIYDLLIAHRTADRGPQIGAVPINVRDQAEVARI